MPPTFFDTEYYLNAKLAQAKSAGETDPSGKPYTLETLQAAITAAGMTPEQHYMLCGRGENLNPNAYFNEAEYLAAKLNALKNNAESKAEWAGKTTADLVRVMADSGMNPAEHYARYGAFETNPDGTLLNPSNAFDANAYYAAKLQQMIVKGETLNGKKPTDLTVAEVVKAVQDAGMSAVSHFLQYGAAEANQQTIPLVQTVPQDQRVPNDPQRPASENVPPNYNQPSKGPASSTPHEVMKPADMGGYTEVNISKPVVPPAKPVPVPGDAGYVSPPAHVVDTGSTTVFPPTTSGGTGPNAGWVVVDSTTGKGQVIGTDGAVKGDITLPVNGGSVSPPTSDTPVYDSNGNNINGGGSDPSPTPPPKLSLHAERAAGASDRIDIKGDTDEHTRKAEVSLDDTNKLSVVGQEGTVSVLSGDTIDAMAVTGGAPLSMDMRLGNHSDLILKGSTATANDIMIKTAKAVYGGNLNDNLYIEGAGISDVVSLGTGINCVYLDKNGTLDMGKVRLSVNENFQMLLSKEGKGTGYTGTLAVDNNATVAFGVNGVGQVGSHIKVGAGVTMGLAGGKFEGALSFTSAKQTLNVLEDTTLKDFSLGAGGDSLNISGGKSLTLLYDMDKQQGTLTVDSGNTLTLSRSGTGTGTLKGNLHMFSATEAYHTVLRVDEGITIAGQITSDTTSDVVQVLGDATVSNGITLGINTSADGDNGQDSLQIANGKILTLGQALTVQDGGIVQVQLLPKIEGSATLKGDVNMLSTLPGSGNGTELRVGTDTTTETVAGNITINGNITAGVGKDTVTSIGNTTLLGELNLGEGENALSIRGGKMLDLSTGTGKVKVEGGSTLNIRLEPNSTPGSIGTLKGDMDILSEAGETSSVILNNGIHMEGNLTGGAGADSVTIAGALKGSVRLGLGADTLDLISYTSSNKLNVLMGKGDGSDFLANGAYATVERINVPKSNTVGADPKAFTVKVDGYTSLSVWEDNLQIKTGPNSLTELDSAINAKTTNNKAYLLLGSYTTQFSPNGDGSDWLLVYDADASGTTKMEAVLLFGLGTAGNQMHITDNGIFSFTS